MGGIQGWRSEPGPVSGPPRAREGGPSPCVLSDGKPQARRYRPESGAAADRLLTASAYVEAGGGLQTAALRLSSRGGRDGV
jgi:hypothetical protein